MTVTEPAIVETPGRGVQHVWALSTDETILLDLVTTVFTDHWRQINFGPVIEGAAWEVGAPCTPTAITMNDGYVTVDFDAWHFHLCIGEHTASGLNSAGSGAAPARSSTGAWARTPPP